MVKLLLQTDGQTDT